MEAGVHAPDWDRLPISVYGLGEDYECCNVWSLSASSQAQKEQRTVLSVRPFASAMSCERSVRALNAWFSAVNVYN